MPIQECTLPEGGSGWRWGASGHCYPDRADAEKQAAAAHANGYAGDALALDRASARSIDQDGHLHVAQSNISRATVNPYQGREIPDWETLGLDPDRVYQLLRDPAELEKAAASFHNKPLLIKHRPVTASDHDAGAVVGSISNPVFEAPFLKAELVVWRADAIEAIQSGEQQELSSGYRYTADMTPGTYEGVRYDGVMRDISANHVALVKEGRAGPQVVVGDSKMEIPMTKTVLTRKAAAAHGALLVFLRPKLAQDAKIDLAPVLAKVTAKNFKQSRAAIAAGVQAEAKGKLAQDAEIDTKDLAKVLDVIEMLDPAEVDEGGTMDAGEGLSAFLKGLGLSDEDVAKACAMAGGDKPAAMDAEETEEEKKAREAKEAKEKAADKGTKDEPPPFKGKPGAQDDKDKDMVTKPAMDAAIKAAVKDATEAATKRQREIRDAEREVRPHVGDLAMAHDSAEAVYRTALTTLGEDANEMKDLPVAALRSILKRIPIPGTGKKAAVAMDAAGAKSFAERYPEAARIRVQ